jgi:hypothetical protein
MPDPIEQFLATYPPEIQTISLKLRAMVKSAMPQANEILYAKHNHFAYSFTGSSRDSICYICPMKDYARLGFMFGTQHPALQHLVEAAWEDAQTHMKKKP